MRKSSNFLEVPAGCPMSKKSLLMKELNAKEE